MSISFILQLYMLNVMAWWSESSPSIRSGMDDELIVDRYSRLGDLNIGALFPVHRYHPTRFCSIYLRELGVLQRMEALAFAVKEVNNRSDLLPNITLGFVVLDDCYKPTTALAQVLLFAKTPKTCECTCASSFPGSPPLYYDVIGTIGAEGSQNSLQIADVMTLLRTPQISYTATTPSLTNKFQYPYFMRMVPSDRYQAKAIVDLLVHFNWTYVSIVYADSTYGIGGFKGIRNLLFNYNICLAATIEVSQDYDTLDYMELVSTLSSENARVVIIFAPLVIAQSVLIAVRAGGYHYNFTFIGSDAWGRNIQDLEHLEETAHGLLSVQIASNTVDRFDEHFKSLTPESHYDNPWFNDFWENHFMCLINGFNSTPSHRLLCPSNLTWSESNGYKPEIFTSLVMDSVFTYAYALDAYIKGNCSNMNKFEIMNCVTGKGLLSYLKNTSFEGETGAIQFDKNGDGLANYTINNLQRNSEGNYEIHTVATWSSQSRSLLFNGADVQFKQQILNAGNSVPESYCSDPCPVHYKQIPDVKPCCWLCEECDQDQMTYVRDGYIACKNCPKKYWPDQQFFNECIPIEPIHVEFSHPLGITLSTLASIGIVISLMVLGVFIINKDDVLIKACSKELSYLMMAGVIITFLFVFLQLVRPSQGVCLMNYVGFALTFTTLYAPLVTRTNRIYRIFDSGKRSVKRPKMVDGRSQLIIAFSIIGIHMVIIIVVIIVTKDTSYAMEFQPDRRKVQLICFFPNSAFLFSLSYNLILVVSCTFYAIKTRKLPNNYNESRFISFCVYTTILMWLAFIATYFSSTSNAYYKVAFLSTAMIANSTVILACLYIPKVYALYCVSKEELNINTGMTSYHGNQNRWRKSKIPASFIGKLQLRKAKQFGNKIDSDHPSVYAVEGDDANGSDEPTVIKNNGVHIKKARLSPIKQQKNDIHISTIAGTSTDSA
ncbi:unnamed protein product [Owenia fusiformis]|uniref:Uncharacterized protein n=1 Tax=Owenia fusiformis TaxID=6347 RepID=A0A8J1XXL3_OWEFU|nr:unnamed protein product [Owenia fusiformis]